MTAKQVEEVTKGEYPLAAEGVVLRRDGTLWGVQPVDAWETNVRGLRHSDNLFSLNAAVFHTILFHRTTGKVSPVSWSTLP